MTVCIMIDALSSEQCDAALSLALNIAGPRPLFNHASVEVTHFGRLS
jgi:hypothetical protein